jgi:cation diffusion facilitator family transporter
MIQTVGVINILANAMFAIIKFGIGTLANSIAIMSDAMNNLSDAISSIITLVGLKLSQKLPDRKHPLGYGRIEYLSSLVIATIILFVGVEFLQSSWERIKSPEPVAVTIFQLFILGITLIGKLLLSRLNITVGKKVNSQALQGSGAEALTDVLASAAAVVNAILARFMGLDLDGYVGLILALFIFYVGIGQLRDTISDILGERAEKELVDAVRLILQKYHQILGSFDYVVHSYGPTLKVGSANLEFIDTLSVKEAYEVMHKAQKQILNEHQIYFTFGLYSVNTYDNEVSKMYQEIRELFAEIPYILNFHAFHVDKEQKVIRFDVVVDFSVKKFDQVRSTIQTLIREQYPDYRLDLTIDLDYA